MAPIALDASGTADPDDALAALVDADGKLDSCEVARASCVQCLDRGRQAGAIK